MNIPIPQLRTLLNTKLIRIGFSRREANIISDEYITGELKGKQSHGVYAFIREYQKMQGDSRYAESPGDAKLIRKFRRRRFRLTTKSAAYAYFAGNHDIGQLVANDAIRLAVRMAKKTGIAMVGGGNIQAFLRPGSWAEKAAQQGMIALCFNYGGGPLMAAPGAREPVLSTNPVGIGIPHKPYPIVIDMATSERAFYHVRLARLFGKKIDAAWGIDSRGNQTTDPNKLIAVSPFGGYKGFSLALAFEILTGPLVRTLVGKRTRLLRGFLFIVINPLAFTTRANFNRSVEQLVREVKSSKTAKGVKSIRIPGEASFQLEAKQRRFGYLVIDPVVYRTIEQL